MPIEPLLLTASDTSGAGTATRRIHEGLREVGIDSRMLVRENSTDDPAIHGPTTKSSKVIAKLRPHIDALPSIAFRINKATERAAFRKSNWFRCLSENYSIRRDFNRAEAVSEAMFRSIDVFRTVLVKAVAFGDG